MPSDPVAEKFPSLKNPYGVTFAPDGTLYVTDSNPGVVKAIDSNGKVTPSYTEWLYPPPLSPEEKAAGYEARFSIGGVGLTFGPNGWLYTTDNPSGKIIGLPRLGVIGMTLGAARGPEGGNSGDGGPVAKAAMRFPHDLAFMPNGDMIIADTYNHRIRRVHDGQIDRFAGRNDIPLRYLFSSIPEPSPDPDFSGDGGPALDARLNTPSSVAVDQDGNVFIADTENNRIRMVATDGRIWTVAGTGVAGYDGDGGPATKAQISKPNGLCFDKAGNLYVADTGNHCVRKIVFATATNK